MATTITKHSFYTPQTSPFPPLAEGRGNDSTVEIEVSSEAMMRSDCGEPCHDVVASSSSCESRDSTTISSSGSSTNTDEGRASDKIMERPSSLSAEDNNLDITGARATVLSSASIDSFDDSPEEEEEIEVRKEDGATELFLLIEGAKWKDVCDRIQENPKETKIWVTSSGKDNALFSWDVWRRLPLHEACRRQAPPAVVYALLSVYPASAHIESNFGELPLHASVRCGACAEVINCILAAYPAAVFARDKSGCTPMDILNGTARNIDHDVIIAALKRTTRFLTKEENMFSWKMQQLELKHKEDTERQDIEYETMLDEKNHEIEELKRQLQQEKKATSNLAAKVIQTETVLEQKLVSEMHNMDMLEKLEGELLDLNASNSSRHTKIVEMEEIIESDRLTIMELTEVIETLRSQLITICEEEEQYVADNMAKAEANLKAMFETQYVFLKETEKRKELMRERLSTLGISMSASISEEEEEVDEEEPSEIPIPPSEEQQSDELTKEPVILSALASATRAVELLMRREEEEGDTVSDVQSTFEHE